MYKSLFNSRIKNILTEMSSWLWIICFVINAGKFVLTGTKPNIVFIVADDLGWNDVSFHGSDEIPTPNIDKLASAGVILNNYYVQPICTPSRSAIMTGRYPIHNGMQEDTIFAPNAWAVGLDQKFLPQALKEQGYVTHAVGKWHLGFYAKEFTPTYRGFDSFYGYYLGKSDYWDHSDVETYWGLDLHQNENPVYTQWGNYSTEMFTAEAEDRIRNHNTSEPMFLYLAYQAVHSANHVEDAIQAPQEWINKFTHIEHVGRRKFAAVVAYMDYGIGRVYEALVSKGMIDNTVIVFTTDNGGPANGFDWNWANNFPLRGVKATLWEGGVRATGFAYSKLFEKPGRTSMDLMHITDWFPTLVKLAGGEPSSDLDGLDQWATLSSGEKSPRNEILLNIDTHTWKNQALRVGDWKLIQETGTWDGWYSPPGLHLDTENTTNTNSKSDYIKFHSSSQVNCGKRPKNVSTCFKTPNYCLFNIKEDPCEYHDLSDTHRDIFNVLLKKLVIYQSSVVPRRNNYTVDPLSNPKLYNGVWKPWMDPL